MNQEVSTLKTADLYLDLLRDCLTRSAVPETWYPMIYPRRSWRSLVMGPLQALLKLNEYYLCQRFKYSPEKRARGLDWPPEAETMIGLERLENVRSCCVDAITRGVPGDFCETGVWRGGACIYMRGILKAFDETVRKVWLCDSFQGLPKATHPCDAGAERWWTYKELVVSLEQVKSNFARYGLLDDQVRFIEGWFHESLPQAPIRQLSVLRLDGDLYQSTWDALVNLYPKLSRGGYLIVDDYNIDQCRRAIGDYRDRNGIDDPIQDIDGMGSFWRKS